MWLFLIFVAVPIIEIALFIQVGGLLGLWPTLLIVIVTAFVGTFLLRQQGMATLANLQGSINQGRNPMDPIAHGAFILISGVLLLTPGFFTDCLGLSFLIPPVRKALIKWMGQRVVASGSIYTQSTDQFTNANTPQNSDIMDGDFEVIDPDKEPGTSGWTKPNS